MTAALILPVEQTRTEGLIGASDAAAILGLDRYRSPITVWRELRGEPRKERPESVQSAARFGQLLEPIIRGIYAQDTNSMVFVPRASVTLDGWLRCTPDGYVRNVEEDTVRDVLIGTYEIDGLDGEHVDGLVQVKTASAYKADEWRDGVPPAYEVQSRVELAVTGLPWCDLICLIGGQQLTQPFRVHRDEKIEHAILRDLWEFWNHVQHGTEPPVDGSDGWREYVSSKMRPTDVELIADEETDKLLGVWAELRRTGAEAKLSMDRIANEVLLRLSAAGATKLVSNEFGKFSAYKTGASTKWKEYALSLGGAAKPPREFVRESTTWAVRAPRGFGGGDGDGGE